MKNKFKKNVCALMIALSIVAGSATTALAYQGGNAKSGASSDEVFQVKYNGAAWNYKSKGSKHSQTWFKYTRNGKTLTTKVVSDGKVTDSVWDDLVHWGSKYTTNFSWGH